VVFFWIVHQGFYGLILPGELLGMGAGIVKTRSKYISVVCGFLVLALGCFTEWRFAPFAADASLEYFVSHLHMMPPITLMMVAAGTLLGFWIPFSRSKKAGKEP
jgi:membrane protein DedA with SNARE-associated domain